MRPEFVQDLPGVEREKQDVVEEVCARHGGPWEIDLLLGVLGDLNLLVNQSGLAGTADGVLAHEL